MKNPVDQVCLIIGNITIGVVCENPAFEQVIRRDYAEFLSEKRSSFQLLLQDKPDRSMNPENSVDHPGYKFTSQAAWITDTRFNGYIDLGSHTAVFSVSPGHLKRSIEYILRFILAMLAFQEGGLLIHAAAVLRNGKAYLFVGKSGAGKSTIAALSKDYQVLSDDLVLVTPQKGVWIASPTPFWNPGWEQSKKAQEAPLYALYSLVKDIHTRLEKPKASVALAEVISNVPVISSDHYQSQGLLARCEALINQVPLYRLHFRKDHSFWSCIDHGVEII